MSGVVAALLLHANPVLLVSGSIFPDIDYAIRSLHRKLFHNVFIIIALWFAQPIVGIGALIHVLLDMLTVSGVALFWPISDRKFRLASFRTGGLFDNILFWSLSVFTWYLLYVNF